MNPRNRTSRGEDPIASRAVRLRVRRIFDALYRTYGPRHWWPGESATEIVIGAILTQNTNWKNVEKAIDSLKNHRLIDWKKLRTVTESDLAPLIRSAGYHNLKAKRLMNFVRWLWTHYDEDLENAAQVSTSQLRDELLSVNGIGPETADSILLYALGRPTFVVDAYTGRMARRHGLIARDHDYEQLKSLFESSLPPEQSLFNEYHALIVEVGKRHCGPKPKCEGCPLARFEHNESA